MSSICSLGIPTTLCYAGWKCNVDMQLRPELLLAAPALGTVVNFVFARTCPECPHMTSSSEDQYQSRLKSAGANSYEVDLANASLSSGPWLACQCTPDYTKSMWRATMIIAGPVTSNLLYIASGWPVISLSLDGNYLSTGDRIQLKQTFCADDGLTYSGGTTAQELINYGQATLSTINNTYASSGALHFSQLHWSLNKNLIPGMYFICWCRPSNIIQPAIDTTVGSISQGNCTNRSEYSVFAGIFEFRRPYFSSTVSYQFGSTDRLVIALQGLGLTGSDRVRLQADCFQNDSVHLETATQSAEGQSYDFGTLQYGYLLAKTYQLCWCTPSSKYGIDCTKSDDFRTFFGEVQFVCAVGLSDYLGDGSCQPCPFIWLEANEDTCIVTTNRVLLSFFIVLSTLVGIVLLSSMLTCRFWPKCSLNGRSIKIEDIGPEGPVKGNDDVMNIIRTASWHNLRALARPIPVTFVGTMHFRLDSKPGSEKKFMVRYDGPKRLVLLDRKGQPLQERIDTSMGSIKLTAFRSLLNTVTPFIPIHISMLALCFVALSFGLLGGFQAPLSSYLVLEFVAIGASCPFVLLTSSTRMHAKSRMEVALREFSSKLAVMTPNPVACERGPQRALSVSQLLELFTFFKGFITDRTMYYVEPNIVRPLTAPHELSYAELAGPKLVQWFISHWWGTEFQCFCETIQRHATSHPDGNVLQSACRPGTKHFDDCCQGSTYWICTFSNNQYKIKEELGSTHNDSSFYLALRSGFCKGTCMVLDAEAKPLTRSWCLFELLETINLEKIQTGFKGLLFCTQTGVLNYGAATVELSISIGKRLGTMRLEDADATWQEDKDMINELVIAEMGSFDSINRVLREHIARALKVCRTKVDSDFHSLLVSLLDNHALPPESVIIAEGGSLGGMHGELTPTEPPGGHRALDVDSPVEA